MILFSEQKYQRFSNESSQNLSCGAASDSLFCSMLACGRQQKLFENIGNLNTILSFNTFLTTSCYVRQNIFSPEGGSAKYRAGFYKYTSSTTSSSLFLLSLASPSSSASSIVYRRTFICSLQWILLSITLVFSPSEEGIW